MRNLVKLIALSFSFIIMACGQKNGEQEAKYMQQHDDSLKAAIETEINGQLQRQDDSLKMIVSNVSSSSNGNVGNSGNPGTVTMGQVSDLLQKQNALNDDKIFLGKLNNLLNQYKAKLEFENSELVRVEQFHMGRMKTEREQQIRQQSLRVQAYQAQVEKIQEAIITVDNKIIELHTEISQASASR